MEFIRNFPFFSILLSLGSGVLTSIMNRKVARLWNTFVLLAVTAMSAVLFVYMLGVGESYTFMMGHFPAPWGNEIRAGVLEAGMALFFCIVMLLSMKGGEEHIDTEIEETKVNLYYIMINLLLSSLLALIYTNDLFTAYVFVEINTISACGLIMIRQSGRTIEAATRYMIMSSLGSGLLLMGLCVLYDITASFDEQYQGEHCLCVRAGDLRHSPCGVDWDDMCRACHQECALSVPHMAAGCIWVFDCIQCGDIVEPCLKGIYLSAD